MAVMVAFQFLNEWEAPTTTPEPFDESEIQGIEARIGEVRSAIVSGDMRVSDAAPALRELNALLDAARARESEHAKRVAEAVSWHREKQEAIMSGDNGGASLEIRTVLDNVVVLPGKAGYRWESRIGQIHETLIEDVDGQMLVRIV
jgi:hypothetical protein